MSAAPRYLVSALTTVYRAERFMRGLLEDLEAQTIADRVQIVIVDSASPTGEHAIVEEFQRRYGNILYTRTDEREGILAAMNRAIALAEGKYVTPASADDRHRCDAFERLVAVLEADPEVGLAYADAAITRSENETFASAQAGGRLIGHFRWPEFDPRLLFQVCCVGPQPMWRRALHDGLGGFDPAYVTAGDYDLYLRFAAAGVRFRHLTEVLGLYLMAPGGNEYSNLELSRIESEQARERHWPAAWGTRPAPGGSYLVPLPADPAWAAASDGGAPEPPPAGAGAPGAEPRAAATTPSGAAARPLVSVIVPTKDRPIWLRRALESVVAQSYPRVEIVVVNDGGCEVADVLAPLRGARPILYVSLPETRERSVARNLGVMLARGTYVAYLDDDDWFYPDHLETLVSALEEQGAAVAYADAHRVLEVRQGSTYVTRGMDQPYSYDFDRERLLAGNYIPILCLLHRRDCLERVGLFDEQLATHEDWDLLIRLSRAYDFIHVREVTCAFSWRTDGSSTTSERKGDFQRTGAIVAQRHRGQPPAAREAGRAPAGTRAFVCSIVVPVWDRVGLTTQCLTALAQVTRTPEFEVIVVDNGSTDETPAFLARLEGDVQVIHNDTNLGFARACNQGARAARGRYVVFLNNDTIPLAGWLDALVAEAEADPAIAVVGSRLLFPNGTVQHAGVAFARYQSTPYHIFQGLPCDLAAVNRRRELQVVTGACMLVRRTVFETMGGFDEEFENGFEDVDLCLRIRAEGGRVVYQPRSTLIHLESQTPGRHDHDVANGQRLRARWGHRCLDDEDLIYAEDDCVLRSRVVGGRLDLTVAKVTSMTESEAWARLLEAERRALDQGARAALPLLADAEAWPADVLALEWAARLCRRAGQRALALPFLRRALAIAELPEARGALAELEAAGCEDPVVAGSAACESA
jgi:GT2 family glycosyltransferase